MEAAAATAPPETEATEVSVKLYNKPKTMEAAAATAQPETEDWVCFDNSNDESTTNAPNSVSNKKSGKSSITNNTNNNSNNREQSCAAAAAAASSTAYSFTGSALGSGSIANLNETTLKSTTMNNDNTTKPAGNNSGNSKPIIDEEDNNKADDSLYECNICLDTAKDAVVSMCGHLFCWPCLHQWLETRPNRKLCPVCKAAVDKDKVIPLYGRNSVNQEDPRNKVPPRPAGQRTEPEPQQGFTGFGFGDGFHMSFGIGAFPFGFFTSSLNFGEPRPPAANRGTTQYEDDQTLSKLFLYLAFMCIAWLLFA